MTTKAKKPRRIPGAKWKYEDGKVTLVDTGGDRIEVVAWAGSYGWSVTCEQLDSGKHDSAKTPEEALRKMRSMLQDARKRRLRIRREIDALNIKYRRQTDRMEALFGR